eukprot:9385064-Pyramimonas_sp.AAC.1
MEQVIGWSKCGTGDDGGPQKVMKLLAVMAVRVGVHRFRHGVSRGNGNQNTCKEKRSEGFGEKR